MSPERKIHDNVKIRINGRKPKSSIEEWCKHLENGLPKIKEVPKENVMSIKKTLAGGIFICEPK